MYTQQYWCLMHAESSIGLCDMTPMHWDPHLCACTHASLQRILLKLHNAMWILFVITHKNLFPHTCADWFTWHTGFEKLWVFYIRKRACMCHAFLASMSCCGCRDEFMVKYQSNCHWNILFNFFLVYMFIWLSHAMCHTTHVWCAPSL